jgi:hypothetical protein
MLHALLRSKQAMKRQIGTVEKSKAKNISRNDEIGEMKCKGLQEIVNFSLPLDRIERLFGTVFYSESDKFARISHNTGILICVLVC